MSRALFLSIALLLAPNPAFAQTAYFSAADDLPLPPGFAESAPPAVFEAEEGRIVALSAEGAGEGLAIRDFYDEALPALGWSVSPRDDGVREFRRGRERLTFTLERAGARWLLGAQLVAVAPPAD